MPRKIRQLEADLKKVGFVLVPGVGKGSHRGFQHPDLPELKVILSGQSGSDAKDYQERDVKNAIRQIENLR
jgi:predicted RNA binding protein YcfA (HicA-like mRNA interferase family)